MVWILILADLCGPHFRPQIQGEMLWNFQAWANIQTFPGFTCCGLHWLWNLETIRVWYTLFSYKNLSSDGEKLITMFLFSSVPSYTLEVVTKFCSFLNKFRTGTWIRRNFDHFCQKMPRNCHWDSEMFILFLTNTVAVCFRFIYGCTRRRYSRNEELTQLGWA